MLQEPCNTTAGCTAHVARPLWASVHSPLPPPRSADSGPAHGRSAQLGGPAHARHAACLDAPAGRLGTGAPRLQGGRLRVARGKLPWPRPRLTLTRPSVSDRRHRGGPDAAAVPRRPVACVPGGSQACPAVSTLASRDLAGSRPQVSRDGQRGSCFQNSGCSSDPLKSCIFGSS